MELKYKMQLSTLYLDNVQNDTPQVSFSANYILARKFRFF